MTYEQEFGTTISTLLTEQGFTATGLGGNLEGWVKPISNGRSLLLTAYEGQLYASPNENCWYVCVTADDESEPDSKTENVTLAAALAWASLAEAH